MSESTWNPSPAGDTLATIQKGVAGYVLAPEDPEVIDCANQGIRRAIDMLNTKTWNWALAYDGITFVEDQYDYPLSGWFKAPRNFEVWNPSDLREFRLGYKPWKTFLSEHSRIPTGCGPSYYSLQNPSTNGLVTLDAAPSASWIAAHPNGRISYYRRVQYPSATGTFLGVPSEVVAFIQAQAEGYTADRFAQVKARDAYARANNLFTRLEIDDNSGQQTDWED